MLDVGENLIHIIIYDGKTITTSWILFCNISIRINLVYVETIKSACLWFAEVTPSGAEASCWSYETAEGTTCFSKPIQQTQVKITETDTTRYIHVKQNGTSLRVFRETSV